MKPGGLCRGHPESTRLSAMAVTMIKLVAVFLVGQQSTVSPLLTAGAPRLENTPEALAEAKATCGGTIRGRRVQDPNDCGRYFRCSFFKNIPDIVFHCPNGYRADVRGLKPCVVDISCNGQVQPTTAIAILPDVVPSVLVPVSNRANFEETPASTTTTTTTAATTTPVSTTTTSTSTTSSTEGTTAPFTTPGPPFDPSNQANANGGGQMSRGSLLEYQNVVADEESRSILRSGGNRQSVAPPVTTAPTEPTSPRNTASLRSNINNVMVDTEILDNTSTASNDAKEACTGLTSVLLKDEADCTRYFRCSSHPVLPDLAFVCPAGYRAEPSPGFRSCVPDPTCIKTFQHNLFSQ